MRGVAPDAPLGVQVEYPDPSAVLLRVHGEVDASTASTLRATLIEHLAHPERRLIVDLAGIAFMGTAGLVVLIEANKHHPDLRLASAAPMVLKTLELTALNTWFRVYDTVGAAMADDSRSPA